MNRKFYLRTAVLSLLVVGFGVSSCVNKDYRIDEIDKGVHLAPNGLSIPLAKLQKKYLGDIIDIDYIVKGEDGYYLLRYDSIIKYDVDGFEVPEITLEDIAGLFTPEEISPTDGEPLPDDVTLPDNETDVPMDIPSFDFSEGNTIEGLKLDRPGDFPTGLNFGVPIPPGQPYSGTIASNEGEIEIDFGLPKEIAKVNTVELGPGVGSLVEISLDLGELANINGNLTITELKVELPKRYTLTSAGIGNITGVDGGTANAWTITNINVGAESTYSINAFYISELSLADKTPTAIVPAPTDPDAATHEISFKEDFSYSISYALTTKAGTVNAAGVKPSIKIDGEPEFKDASFTTKTIDFSLEDGPFVEALDYEVGRFPSTIEKIDKIAFKSIGNSIRVTMNDLNLPFTKAENDPVITVKFPSIFHFETDPNISTQNVLTAPASEFYGAGYELKIANVTFGPGEGIPNTFGYINFAEYNYNVEVNVNHSFIPEDLTYLGDIEGNDPPANIKVVIEGAPLTIDYDNSVMLITQVAKEVNGTKNIEEQFKLPPEIKEIDKILVEAAESTEVTLTVSVDIENPLLDEFYLDQLKIELPSFVILKSHPNVTDNVYYKDRMTITRPGASNNFNVELAKVVVTGFKDVDISKVVDEVFGLIEGDVHYEAIARTPIGSSVNPSADNMLVTPKLEITDIRVTALEGMFDFSLDEYIADKLEPISLKEIYDVLGSGEQKPALAAPVIKLEISNPVGINLLGKIELDPLDGNGGSLGKISMGSDEYLKINPAAGKTPERTKIYITNDGKESAPAGYTGYSLPISNLVTEIPHSIRVDVTAGINPDRNLTNTIRLGEDYPFEMKYEVEVPLAFGSDMNMNIAFTADNLNGTFADLAEQHVKVKDITINAGFLMTMPLKFEGNDVNTKIKVELTDSEGNEIEGLTTVVSGSLKGPVNGAVARRSTLKIKIGVPDGGDFAALSAVDKLNISIPITATGDENKLSANDSIEGDIWIELAKGVNIDVDKLLSGSDEE